MLKASQNRTNRAPLTAGGMAGWTVQSCRCQVGVKRKMPLTAEAQAVGHQPGGTYSRQGAGSACTAGLSLFVPLACSLGLSSLQTQSLPEASMSRQPASTAGWLATTPTVRPLSRAKPAG